MVVNKLTDPLSEKKTLDAHPLPGPSSSRRVHSTAGSCVLSGKMTWPHRPAAYAMACTILGCSWALTPCTQQRLQLSQMLNANKFREAILQYLDSSGDRYHLTCHAHSEELLGLLIGRPGQIGIWRTMQFQQVIQACTLRPCTA